MAAYYRPPGDINDFDRRPALANQLRTEWDAYIGGAIAGRDEYLFYDAAHDPAPGVAPATQPVPWNAFPRSIWQWFKADTDPAGPAQAFAAADTLAPELAVRESGTGQVVELFARQQDEYCEWHAHRNAAGGITRITFTCEGPEYFSTMAARDVTLVGDLYRENVDPAVQDADLVWARDMEDANGDVVFSAGTYNPLNAWNTTRGAMHLTHGANTLGAEINLAADATRIAPVPSQPANTLPHRLICCAAYGGVNRSSDPTIGAGVNSLARSGIAVTLANPVGLYMTEIAIDGLRSPDGQAIGPQALRIRRASPDGTLILRAEVAVPAGAAYTLDQCTFNGAPVTGGGVIARSITMSLFGLAKVIPGRTPEQTPCRAKCCRHPNGAAFFAAVSINRSCADLDSAFWARQGPVTPRATLGAEGPPFLATAVNLKKRAAAGRGPVLP
jgi:hypothetical protein